MIVAAIGLVCTIRGLGPFWIASSDPRFQAFFFQFFIAASLLTVMPIAAALSARNDAMQQLADRERVLRLLTAQSPNLLLSFDTAGVCQYAAGASFALFGRSPKSFVGDEFGDFAQDPTLLQAAHERVQADPDCCEPIEFQAVDDSEKYLEASFRLTLNEKGQCIGTLASIHDITARKLQELAWARSATTDGLTGVLNREGFLTRLQDAIDNAGPDGFSLAVIDIDRFKLINDNGGHVVGDVVLKHIAATMEYELRQSDVIGRLGGDEFVILLSSADWVDAQEICNRLVTVVRETPISLSSGHTLNAAISCGLARYRPGLDAEQLIEQADKALYRAKRAGRDRVAAI
jgi:diguanylate cyclase (GGDEF)-like protein